MNTEPTASTAFQRAKPTDTPPAGCAKWLLFDNGELIIRDRETVDLESLPSTVDLPSNFATPLYLGRSGETAYFAEDIHIEQVPAGLIKMGLRAVLGQSTEELWNLADYASQMLYWRRTGHYCPACGSVTEPRQQDWGRVCPNCGHVGYPRVSPAVLMLIHRDDQILLASKPGWSLFSILAGFVEPAETLEECVRRETFEEVGLEVTDIRYVSSQSWPFPHQLMVGFMARYASGEITVDGEEIDRASWYTRENLPPLPPKISLSRQMIDAWVDSLA